MCLNLIWYVTLYTHNDFRASVYNTIVQLPGILTNAHPHHILQSVNALQWETPNNKSD
jgi:hypothetical protein